MADDDLVRVLSEIQRRGAIGSGPISAAIAHADRFVAAAPPSLRAVDLGSGGGLPGLVIAVRLPSLQLTLVERRAKRVDLLRYGVRALGLVERVTVFDGDAEDVAATLAAPVDLVTARSFAPVLVVLQVAAPMLRPGGSVLVSDPPGGRPHLSDAELIAAGFRDAGVDAGVHRFVRL